MVLHAGWGAWLPDNIQRAACRLEHRAQSRGPGDIVPSRMTRLCNPTAICRSPRKFGLLSTIRTTILNAWIQPPWIIARPLSGPRHRLLLLFADPVAGVLLLPGVGTRPPPDRVL